MKSTFSRITLLVTTLLAAGCSDEPIDTDINGVPAPGGGGAAPAPSNAQPPGTTAPPVAGSPADWIGRTFILQVPQTNWREPRNVGGEIGPYVPYFLLSVGGTADAPTVTIGGTYDATGATQDLCTPTWTGPLTLGPFPSSSVTIDAFPAFIRVNDSAEMVSITQQITIHQLSLIDVLPAGTTPTSSGQLIATMDLDESYTLFYKPPQESGEAACTTLTSALAVQCETCAHSSQPRCLTLKAVGIGATEVQGLTVQEVTQPDATACAATNTSTP